MNLLPYLLLSLTAVLVEEPGPASVKTDEAPLAAPVQEVAPVTTPPVPEPGPLALAPATFLDERVVIAPGKGLTVKSLDGRYFVQAGLMVSKLVEVTARWDQLYALSGTDPALVTLAATQGRQLGGGVNVYLNGHGFKLQADYFYIWGSAALNGRHAARIALDASF